MKGHRKGGVPFFVPAKWDKGCIYMIYTGYILNGKWVTYSGFIFIDILNLFLK